MRKFIFPITTGRSGTAFVTELLRENWKGADVHHERTGYTAMGVDSPDASHSMLFNSVGNVPKVKKFWGIKLDRILSRQFDTYAEISHYLFKAGLVENIEALTAEGEVHFILLTRDVAKIHWSYVNRHEFTNNGYTWITALDPKYPNTLVSSRFFEPYGAMGYALWYVYEVFARMEYYALMLADVPNVFITRVDLSDIVNRSGAEKLLLSLGCDSRPKTVKLPAKTNATQKYIYSANMQERCANFIRNAPFDPKETARDYFDRGRRLAFAGHKSMPDWSKLDHPLD